MSMFGSQNMQENNKIFEKAFREIKKGRIEGNNIYIYIYIYIYI